MNFILYSDIGESTIDKSLGLPEYSYYFVLKAFRSALAELGTVTLVRHPETEVDLLFEACRQRGEECVFLSFSPPSKTSIELKCPTVSVFAWEYSNIPNEQWGEDPRSDWRNVFARHGRAITLSGYTASAVKDAMGSDFPVLAVPAPLWEQFAGSRERLRYSGLGAQSEIRLRGTVIDSRVLGLSADGLIANLAPPEVAPASPVAALPPVVEREPLPAPAAMKNLRYRLGATKRHLLGWYRDVLRDLLPLWLAKALAISGRKGYAMIRVERPTPALSSELPPPATVAPEPETSVRLDGVVYTSVFSPKDGRKNWFDMVTAFCWTFREVEDVTLVLKMNERDLSSYRTTLMTLLSQLAPFKCRVVTLHAFLDDDAYEQLIGATTYYVNTSLCEGLCLPLMEFMSCGKPAIAPMHTAMADYIDEQVAFVVKSGLEQNVWPHDPRDLFRTLRYRLDWASICSAYRESYRVARQAPETYAQMREHTLQRMQSYASVDTVRRQLQGFFQQTGRSRVLPDAVRDTVPVALTGRLT